MKISCILLAAVLTLTLSACTAPASSAPASAAEPSSAQSSAPASSSEAASSPESTSAIHFDSFYVAPPDSSTSALNAGSASGAASVSTPEFATPDSDAFNHFEAGLADLGISYSERVTMAAEYVGGEAGYKYKCDGYNIELYQFDPESDAYKKAESEGIVTLEDFGDFSACAHDGLVLLNNDSLPQEVIDLFNSL